MSELNTIDKTLNSTYRIIGIAAFLIVVLGGSYWWINQGISDEELYESSETVLNTIQINGLRVGEKTVLSLNGQPATTIYLNITLENPTQHELTLNLLYISIQNFGSDIIEPVGYLYNIRKSFEPGTVNTFELEGYTPDGTEYNSLLYSLEEGLNYAIGSGTIESTSIEAQGKIVKINMWATQDGAIKVEWDKDV